VPDITKIGVVVPAYNEEKLIAETIQGIPGFVDRIYAVDDCSTDETSRVLKSLSKQESRIVYRCHKQNKGPGAAILTGYRQLINDNIDIGVTMDGDNQMDPVQLGRMIEPILRKEADYVKGDRLSAKMNHKGMSRWRLFGNKILARLTRITTGNGLINDPQNGYTAISLEALKKIDVNTIYPGYGYLNDVLVKLAVHKFEVANVAMPARYDTERSSIKYFEYIPKVAFLLLKNLTWRLKVQYLRSTSVLPPVESTEVVE
jgi:glycosyltransferase involved in cell wall biosynthesis